MVVAGKQGMRAQRPRTWLARSLALGLSCITCNPTSDPDPCPDEQPPAFLITVTAVDGSLPSNTRVRLAYGGGNEEYALDSQENRPSVMFCRAEQASFGAGGLGGGAGAGGNLVPSSKLVCELWIEGAATIWVQGGDYIEVAMELSGEANECGPQTVEEELELGAEPPEDQD
jgi:hypothetical protein